METETLLALYNSKLDCYKKLKEEVDFILEQSIERSKIKISHIESRIKKFDSLKRKMEVKQTNNPFEEVTDILGARIICLFLSSLPLIEKLIHENFNVLSKDDKINKGEVDSFGYMSIHYIVEINDSYKGPRYDLIKKVPFEIQLRTLAMHSWANFSHFLSYKTEIDIPIELKKDFHALSALLYIADKHFEMLFREKQLVKKEIRKKLSEEYRDLSQIINLETLTAYTRNKFPDRTESLPVMYSRLVRELHNAGYSRLEDIEKVYDKAYDIFLKYEKETPPEAEKYSTVGVIRVMFDLIDEKFSKLREINEAYEKTYGEYRELLKRKLAQTT